MKLERPIIWLDIEATGTDPQVDRIVELALIIQRPDERRQSWCQRFHPGIPIPPAATEVHHITDADVADCPPFEKLAKRVSDTIAGKDLGGYNLRLFDLPIIDAELRRCKMKLDMRDVRVIDCFGIFAKKEPRKLEDAVRRYCGRDHEGAHGALADTEATLDVFAGQLAAYADLAEMTVDQLAEFSRRSKNREADLAGNLYYDKDNCLRFAFGKYRDHKCADHTDYIFWMLSKDFPGSTCDILAEFLQRGEESPAPPDVSSADVPF